TTDAAGNIFVTGLHVPGFDCDPGPGVDTLSGSGTYVYKLDPSGNHQWGFTVGPNQMTRATSLAVDQSGSLFLSGAFQDKTDFAPGTDTAWIVGPNSQTDAFIMKVCNGIST